VEIRVADVCTDVRDAVLIAVLCRALVETAATGWRQGGPPLPMRPELQRAAIWRAARYGLTDRLMDPVSRTAMPAAEAVDGLLAHVREALERAGDWQLARDHTDRLLRNGSGARRQRQEYARTDDLAAVVRDVITRTVEEPGRGHIDP
jgi:carboxylate-amine ligase